MLKTKIAALTVFEVRILRVILRVEARFFEIRKKSAMTVALSPKKTITY